MHTKTKLALPIVLGSLLTLTLAGCSAGAVETVSDTQKDAAIAELVPAKIAEAGVLRVATTGTNPPFGSLGEDGKTFVGFEPDLAREMGALMGLKVEFVQTSFDGLIPGLASGSSDIAMNSIGDTKEREKVVDFVTYYHNGTDALVAEGNPKGLKADALCGAKVGVLRGSLQQNSMLPEQAQKCIAQGETPPTEAAYPETPAALMALQSGQVDAVLADIPDLVVADKANPDAFQIAGPSFKNPNPGGVALPKGSELSEAIHASIKKLMEDGTYDDFLEKNDLSHIKVEESVINGAQS
ncbi:MULTISPECIES: ABC transporter substrate-binding protein [unclassified Arthrobacter]|uniref:ABC transporter substrate-binding protein n=1 Tax=unclassified Arthrobacter TaxID=235627 RepID=UPI000CE43987|nr:MULTISPECIES: ABC transporter substrate-binding protein [unclassified Arthrobacter]